METTTVTLKIFRLCHIPETKKYSSEEGLLRVGTKFGLKIPEIFFYYSLNATSHFVYFCFHFNHIEFTWGANRIGIR